MKSHLAEAFTIVAGIVVPAEFGEQLGEPCSTGDGLEGHHFLSGPSPFPSTRFFSPKVGPRLIA